MVLYPRVRDFYRRLPVGLRRFVQRYQCLRNMKERFKALLSRRLSPSDIYDAGFFSSRLTPQRSKAYRIMAQTVLELFRPRSVIDVGCGDGSLLYEMQLRGVRCVGIDGSVWAIREAAKRGIDVRQMDLRAPSIEGAGGPYDLALCLEVAEHLPPEYAEGLVQFISQLSQLVVFSAAQPGQGGEGHLNEQPPEYWEKLFNRSGFVKNIDLTTQLRDRWADSAVPSFYRKNVQCFQATNLKVDM